MNIIKVNKDIIRTFNSMNVEEFFNLMDKYYTTMKIEKFLKLFKKKYYIWNFIRMKDFYKLISMWLIYRLESTDGNIISEDDNLIIKTIIDTCNNDDTRVKFIWSIIKKKVVFTQYTYPYIKDIEGMFRKRIVTDFLYDGYMEPIVNTIVRLEEMIEDFKHID